MLTVKTWCLPAGLSQNKLEALHNAIVDAVMSVPSTEVKSENDMLNLFPPDAMMYGLGREIEVEVDDVPYNANRIQLAREIGGAVKSIFPEANVFCRVRNPDPEDGKWSSK